MYFTCEYLSLFPGNVLSQKRLGVTSDLWKPWEETLLLLYLPFGVDPLPCLALSVRLPLNNWSPSPVLSCGAAPECGVCWTTQERCRKVFRTRFLRLVRPGEEKKVTRYQNNQKFSLLSYTPSVHLGFAVAALIQMRPRVQVGGW